MAQFKGTVKGQRGEASRLGGKKSGLEVTANGWNDGIRISVKHIDGKDMFTIYRTAGSNGNYLNEICSFGEGQPIELAGVNK